ncbi:hypothetical protein ANO11243_058140 [Dothideomycetidae sp. 11243]|nr:hypothetical protein ANO11243_058140 [fungal sp. No.11243]
MRVQYVALASVGLAAAHPHQHAHLHHLHEKRDATPVVATVVVTGPTIVLYSLNGQIISDAEVKQGISNGTLIWANGAPQSAAATPVATPTTTAAPAPEPTTAEAPVKTSAAAVAAPAATTAAAAAPSTNNNNAGSSGGASWSVATGVDTPFPDGTLDCSEFPSAYGALNIDWFNLGGWIGIQSPGQVDSAGYSQITTVEGSSCNGNNCCGEGDFCSYACPAGYQKSQWPSTQGATAQSVGGLQCLNGKLHMTNPGLASTLCMQGTQAVTIQVQNTLGQEVAVCRTDYPGTEAETVPLQVDAGSTQPLTCPDTDNYYKWLGQPTSAQYYVNPAGVSVQDGCQWGSGGDTGNWAPLNLGVGYSNGVAYVGMLPNKPTTDATLAYKVTLSGSDTGETCTYENGMFYSSILPGGSSSNGCTLSASSGTMTYVFS